MTRQRLYLVAGLLTAVALLVTACGAEGSEAIDDTVPIEELPKNDKGYADISVQQLAGLLENKTFTLVNVHIPYEGEIPQTDLFIPYNEIGSHVDQLPEKDAPLVLYCRSGGMSTSAAEELVSLGYTNVLELDGGFTAWEAAGYELLDKQ
jgi:rhodanese-related sulfurtransferase